MDSFGFCNIKAEKANARLRFRRLRKITAMFRLIELCIFMFIVSRFTTHQLPAVFKLSGEYFKGVSLTATAAAVISPRFVFILGNVIVIVLFLKSGQLSGKVDDNSNGSSSHRKLDFYDEYVRRCEKNRNVYIHEFEKYRKQSATASCCVMVKKKEVNSSSDLINLPKIKEEEEKKRKTMNRSQSENLKRHHHDAVARVRELKRTVTDISVDNRVKTAVSSYAEDRMSSEEFRRTVEDFIARHQRNLREEEFSVTDSFETSY